MGNREFFHWVHQERALEQLYKLIETHEDLFIAATMPIAQSKPTSKKDRRIKKLLVDYLGL